MSTMSGSNREQFQIVAGHGAEPAITEHLAAEIRDGAANPTDCHELAAQFAHVAFAAPWMVVETYDAAAKGWLGAHAVPRIDLSPTLQTPLPIATPFWDAFWDVAGGSRASDPLDFTMQTLKLNGLLDSRFLDASVAVSRLYPAVCLAASQGYPKLFRLEDLSACPEGSLGHQFFRLIVDNKFDLEVLDRDALGLSDLPPPLDYLNARMLQSHDLWHIGADYKTTALHEVGISAFQLAQFGHAYSASFLAVVLASSMTVPHLFAILMDVIMTGWRHGRTSPSLLTVDWAALWHRPTGDVRAAIGLAAYESPHAADLFEALTSAPPAS